MFEKSTFSFSVIFGSFWEFSDLTDGGDREGGVVEYDEFKGMRIMGDKATENFEFYSFFKRIYSFGCA